ncbi:MAG: zinc-ribbon domain containing protein [Chloroflexota bacterium]
MAKRNKRGAKRGAATEAHAAPYRTVPVDESQLAPNNSYGAPDFVRRGYYLDKPFRCVDCGKEEVWTGNQQKWWYEVAKGFVYSAAIRCRVCRRKERARREEARQRHQEGIARKTKVTEKPS